VVIVHENWIVFGPLILLWIVPVSSELKKQAEKPITSSEKIRSLSMREIIGNFPERARNFHQNISGMWIP
jgi:hypothetical protein